MRLIDDNDFYGGNKNMIYSFNMTNPRRNRGTAKFEIDCTAGEFQRIKLAIRNELEPRLIDFEPPEVLVWNHQHDVIASMWTPCIRIKKVIFNNPATIIIWSDGSKTVVKVQNGEEYDPEKGMALCCAKKLLGNKSNFNNEFKKWLPKEDQND